MNANTKRILRRFRKSRVGMIGLVMCLVMLLIAVLAPLISPFDPDQPSLRERYKPPSETHWLGTDDLGRDVMSRVFAGTRITVVVGLCAVFIALVLGTALGLVSGYFGGKVDLVINGVMDALWAFPAIILALAITSALGSSLFNIFLAIGIVYTPAFCRLTRSRVLTIREMEYVMGARAIGHSNPTIIVKYVLPNLMSTLIVQVTLSSAQAIIAEASLSFLGLGIQLPAASLGSMLKTGYTFLARAPWMSIYPGLAIMLLVLGLNFLGDGLRDALDVRIRAD